MSALRLIFAGTPDFAVPALQALLSVGHRPVAVLTQPDRPAGRGRQLRPSAVKQWALDAGLTVLQPESLKASAAQAEVARCQPDLIITAAYGLLLPAAVLALPRHGCWNLHASLLPRWRGASPIQQAILAGDAETGIALMQMDVGLDTGPVLLTERLAIGEHETAGELHDRLAPLAASLLIRGVQALEDGTLPAPRPQNDAEATLAPLIQRQHAELDFGLSAAQLVRQVRAYNPWPIAWTTLDGQMIRIFKAQVGPSVAAAPGTVVREHGRGPVIVVACGQDSLEILALQTPGKRCVSAEEWLNGHPNWR